MKAKNKPQGRRAMAPPESLQALAFSRLDPDLAEMAEGWDAEQCQKMAARFAAWRGQLLRYIAALIGLASSGQAYTLTDSGGPVLMDHPLQHMWGHLDEEERRLLADRLDGHVQQLRASADLLDGRVLLANAGN